MNYRVLSISLSFLTTTLCGAPFDVTWQTSSNDFWGSSSNWNPANVPGTSGNNDDIVHFADLSPIEQQSVILVDTFGSLPIDVTLHEIEFNSIDTSYTISEYSNLGKIILDSTVNSPQINVLTGLHTIDAPIDLILDSEIVLTDNAVLVLQSNCNLKSNNQEQLFVQQSLSSTAGSGRLFNSGTLTPYDMWVSTGIVSNFSVISPTHNLSIEADSASANAEMLNYSVIEPLGECVIGGLGNTTVANNISDSVFSSVGKTTIGNSGETTLSNFGTNSKFGPTGLNSDFEVVGDGVTFIRNFGAKAQCGSFYEGDFHLAASGVVHIINEGPDSELGAFGTSGQFYTSGDGTYFIINSGYGSKLGAFGGFGDVIFNGTNPIHIQNIGDHSSFGAFGTGGTLNVSSDSVDIINSGLKTELGAFGSGGNVDFGPGLLQNSDGAVFTAGSGGLMTIQGGQINNDLLSVVGSTDANLLFSLGSLDTSGDVLAFNYTQVSSANLKLNITSAPANICGNIKASGIANLNGNIAIKALKGSHVSSNSVVTILRAKKGIIGRFSHESFQNFPSKLIPVIIYKPNAVQLMITDAVGPDSPHAAGTLSQLPSTLSSATQFVLNRKMNALHLRLKRKKMLDEVLVSANTVNQDDLLANSDSILQHKSTQMKTRLVEQTDGRPKKPINSNSVYIAPLGGLGVFHDKGSAQVGFGYFRSGVMVGADHVATQFGMGVEADYGFVDANLQHDSGKFDVNQVHTSAYATFVPRCYQAFAINALLGWAYDWFDITRVAGPTTLPQNAKGKTNGSTWDALIGVEYSFSHENYCSFPESLTFTPVLDLRYLGASIDDYHEHGAGIYDLLVSAPDAKWLQSMLGARINYLWKGEDLSFQPEIDAGWLYNYLSDRKQASFSTMGLPHPQSFSMPIVGIGRNAIWLGIDFLITVCNSFQFEASYDFQWNRLNNDHSFYMGIGGEF